MIYAATAPLLILFQNESSISLEQFQLDDAITDLNLDDDATPLYVDGGP